MTNVTGQGTVWNLPNYAGDLFTADAENTPFLTMIGGLTGGVVTNNFEFPTNSAYEYPAAAQPAITENDSLNAPDGTEFVRTQHKNVTQIFQEAVKISYVKLSNMGRMSGLNTAGQQSNVVDEKAWQIATALKKIARDIEYTCLNGSYNLATKADEANKTRGMLEACTSSAVNAGGVALTKALMQQLFKEMFDNGAVFDNTVIWVNSFQKQKISEIYGYAPNDRNVGGVNIKQIETDFGNIGIALNRFMPAGSLLCADMATIKPVFQPVPGKGNFFYEELAKAGASEDGQIYGQFGLDHSAEFLHGKIYGLATE